MQGLGASESESNSLWKIICEAFDKSKSGFFASQHLHVFIDKLKVLKSQAPKDNEDIKNKASWIKNVAAVFLESKIFQQFFEQVNIQIPDIWSQLTLSQKLKLGAIAPLVGAGSYLGGIGIVGAGSGVGLSVITVTLLFLMINNSLVDFLDFVIRQLSSTMQSEPGHDAIAKAFEEALSQSIISVFGKEHGPESGQRTDEVNRFDETNSAREFEVKAVSVLAKKYNGIGYVTQYSSDGGIDGYIVSEANKEVILVQAKHYQGKVGFPEATQYLGTFFYWKNQFDSKFEYPISKIILVCSTDFSIEAMKVASAFPDVLVFEKVL